MQEIMRFNWTHTYAWCIRYKDNPSERVFKGRTGDLHRTPVYRHIKIRKGAGFLTVPSQATGLYIRFKETYLPTSEKLLPSEAEKIM